MTVKTSIDRYFEKCGLDVSFNTLGRTEELIRAYLTDTQDIVDAEANKLSHHVKHQCYQKFFNIEARSKYTGFEEVEQVCRDFKTNMSSVISELQFSPTLIVDKKTEITSDYKKALKDSFSDFTKPIFLYLSGGMDSEVVAMALLESDRQFTPVIFDWTDKEGKILNSFDTKYAVDFCKKHSITPVRKSVDIETLWASEEFKQLAIDVQLISPHLVSYVHMVHEIAKEHKDVTHVLGGEVRYIGNYLQDDKTIANLVTLGKVAPGYSTALNTVAAGVTGSIWLTYNAGGTWSISGSGTASVISGGALSGNWAVPTLNPGGYEYSITSVTVNFSNPGSNTPSAPTGYSTISGGTICSVTRSAGSGGTRDVTFGIAVRPIGFPAQVQTSSIRLIVDNT